VWALSVQDISSNESIVQKALSSVVHSGNRLLTLGSLDSPSGDHMRRVDKLAGRAAAWLALGPNEVRVTRCAALLHDLGKVLIPPSILNKPGKLSEGEWAIVRRHPEIGAELLSKISGFERVREVIATHHERPDGGGYPAGLPSKDSPIEACLIAVADAYDAMTTDRPYRKALSHDKAIEQLNLGAGSQFDPNAVEAVEATLIQVPDEDLGSPLQSVVRKKTTRGR
jgi:putative nucleotidyltransferase with HDIG domain